MHLTLEGREPRLTLPETLLSFDLSELSIGIDGSDSAGNVGLGGSLAAISGGLTFCRRLEGTDGPEGGERRSAVEGAVYYRDKKVYISPCSVWMWCVDVKRSYVVWKPLQILERTQVSVRSAWRDKVVGRSLASICTLPLFLRSTSALFVSHRAFSFSAAYASVFGGLDRFAPPLKEPPCSRLTFFFFSVIISKSSS